MKKYGSKQKCLLPSTQNFVIIKFAKYANKNKIIGKNAKITPITWNNLRNLKFKNFSLVILLRLVISKT